MKLLMTGECIEDNIFQLVDPTAFVEIDFEAEVVKALNGPSAGSGSMTFGMGLRSGLSARAWTSTACRGI